MMRLGWQINTVSCTSKRCNKKGKRGQGGKPKKKSIRGGGGSEKKGNFRKEKNAS